MQFFAYTDGACSGNPGPGGWGVLLVAYDDEKIIKRREIKGGESWTTNNRMELQAAIAALEVLEKPSEITIVTDSAYVKNGITVWLHSWKKKNWKTSNNKPVKNIDLWQTLDTRVQKHNVSWQWVKGHAGHEGNECADNLAREGMTELDGNGDL